MEPQQECVQIRILIAPGAEHAFAEHEGLADKLVDENGWLGAGRSKFPKQLLAEAVDRTGSHLIDIDRIDEGFLLDRKTCVVLERVNDTKTPTQDARAKFLGGFLCEGRCENSTGRNAIDENKL